MVESWVNGMSNLERGRKETIDNLLALKRDIEKIQYKIDQWIAEVNAVQTVEEALAWESKFETCMSELEILCDFY